MRSSRLVCPIGLTEIEDKAPAAIAASIAAQLLIERDKAAASAASNREVSYQRGIRHA